MFQQLRTGQRAVLGDVADEEHGAGGALGKVLKLGRALLQLRNRTRRRLQQVALHRLDGIDNENVRIQGFYMLENLLGAGFREDIAVWCGVAGEAGGTHFELRFALLAGDVEHFLATQFQRHLEQQGGFADAGLAAQQDDAAAHDAASQHTVKLCVSGRCARESREFDVVDDLGAALRQNGRKTAFLGRCGLLEDNLLLEGVPLVAFGTPAQPFRRLRSAVLAVVHRFALRHRGSFWTAKIQKTASCQEAGTIFTSTKDFSRQDRYSCRFCQTGARGRYSYPPRSVCRRI